MQRTALAWNFSSSLLSSAFLLTILFVLGARAEVNVPTANPDRTGYNPLAQNEMDNLASNEDTAKLIESLKADWTLFTEDRAHSIRRTTGLPSRWLNNLPGHTQSFTGTVQPGEFYVFQVGVFAAKAGTGKLAVQFENLPGARCFNLGGTNFLGQPFTKTVQVDKGSLQALWVGMDVPKNAAGVILGRVVVTAGGVSQAIAVRLEVSGPVLDDHGDRDAWRLSRLRWLDSTIGLDDDVVTQPFTPIRRDGQALNVLGRELLLSDAGLPQQIRSFFNGDNTRIESRPQRELLDAPFHLVVETDAGPVKLEPGKVTFQRELKGAVTWEAVARGAGMQLTLQGRLEYDGFSDFRCRLTSAAPMRVKDIRLELNVAPGADTYFMGLGKAGGRCPESLDWKWNANVNQDGFWMGAVNGGFKLQLYGANWRAPLINAYYHFRELAVPESWGSGGIRLAKSAAGTRVAAYTGPRELASGQALDLNFKLFLTPFKPLNTDQQWALRYLHKTQGVNDEDYRDLKRVQAMGANVINIHHNKEQNPTINYPYFDLSMPLLRQCVADAHAHGIKAKIYYTTREITGNLPELFAFWSLNGEIICPSPGKDGRNAHPVTNPKGPHPWLIEHLGDTGYIPAWREVIGGRYQNMPDLAVLTTPDSRLDNFYNEGLAFTLRETGFDGIYIDDTSLGRKGLQRAHRVFEAAGKPLLADMHSWSHMNGHAGMTPSAYLFLQNFPYYHRIWFGEGFNCSMPPDEMLVQQSGIPFGLMSEMLDGPNPWHGLVFGETTRLGWSGDPRPIWKLWDDFSMAGCQMHGWWNPNCPVKTGSSNVLATVYQQPGRSLIAIASWSAAKTNVILTLDWKALGLDPAKTTLRAPAIKNLQTESVFAAESSLPVEPGRGWWLVAEEAPGRSPGSPTSSSR
jgi:hypothetical protein